MEEKSEEKRLRQTTRKKIKPEQEDYYKADKITKEEKEMQDHVESNSVFYGWQCIDDVAKDVWGSIHSSLLNGDLVFAYKCPSKNATLKQIVIVRNFELVDSGMLGVPDPIKHYISYGVGYITSGYTALLPNVPYTYIAEEIVEYLKDWKIDKTIINTYEAIVEELGKEELNNGK